MPKKKKEGSQTRKQMTVYFTQEQLDAINLIRKRYGLISIAETVRFSVNQVYNDIK